MSPYSYSNFTLLKGPKIELLPLTSNDLPALSSSLFSSTSWFAKERGLSSIDLLKDKLNQMLQSQEKGERLALVAHHSDQIVAMSTYHSHAIHRGTFWSVEIGFTWIADSWQKTFVNTEMKFLMLQCAFEVMGCKRVQFAVDPGNLKSNKAMKRIGATLEGVFRRYRPFSDDDSGDRHIYSIVVDEWPKIRIHLENLMLRY